MIFVKTLKNTTQIKKRKILIVLDDMIAAMCCNKKHTIVTELFIRDRKLNITLVFILQSYFWCTKKYCIKFYALFYHEHSK